MNRRHDRDEEEFGGFVDDVKTALKWKPILFMLKNLEQSDTINEKVSAVVEIAEFISITGFDTSPEGRRWHNALLRIALIIKQNPRIQDLIEDALR